MHQRPRRPGQPKIYNTRQVSLAALRGFVFSLSYSYSAKGLEGGASDWLPVECDVVGWSGMKRGNHGSW